MTIQGQPRRRRRRLGYLVTTPSTGGEGGGAPRGGEAARGAPRPRRGPVQAARGDVPAERAEADRRRARGDARGAAGGARVSSWWVNTQCHRSRTRYFASRRDGLIGASPPSRGARIFIILRARRRNTSTSSGTRTSALGGFRKAKAPSAVAKTCLRTTTHATSSTS